MTAEHTERLKCDISDNQYQLSLEYDLKGKSSDDGGKLRRGQSVKKVVERWHANDKHMV